MTAARLSTRLRRYNGKQIVIAVGGFLCAIPLWILSFWLIDEVTTSIVSWVHANGIMRIMVDPSVVGCWVAVVFVGALAVGGIYNAAAPFDLLEFRDSAFYAEGNVRQAALATWQCFGFMRTIFLVRPLISPSSPIASDPLKDRTRIQRRWNARRPHVVNAGA